jgi:hypothetical protein
MTKDAVLNKQSLPTAALGWLGQVLHAIGGAKLCQLLTKRSHHEVLTAGRSGEAIDSQPLSMPRCFRREGMFALFIVTSVTIVTSSRRRSWE